MLPDPPRRSAVTAVDDARTGVLAGKDPGVSDHSPPRALLARAVRDLAARETARYFPGRLHACPLSACRDVGTATAWVGHPPDPRRPVPDRALLWDSHGATDLVHALASRFADEPEPGEWDEEDAGPVPPPVLLWLARSGRPGHGDAEALWWTAVRAAAQETGAVLAFASVTPWGWYWPASGESRTWVRPPRPGR